jgi:hypothetical protein
MADVAVMSRCSQLAGAKKWRRFRASSGFGGSAENHFATGHAGQGGDLMRMPRSKFRSFLYRIVILVALC